MTGVGLGRIGGARSGQLVVTVTSSPTLAFLRRLSRLANDLDVDITVLQTGEIRALGSCHGDPRRPHRPAYPGISVGHPKVTAGTFGGAPRDKAGNPVVLSNNHVIANENDAHPGDAILQPGRHDGGREGRDTFATLRRFAVLERHRPNYVDAAIAEPARSDLIDPRIRCLGQPRGSLDPRIGMEVLKSGRTTGLTRGRVLAVDTTVWVQYNKAPLEFRDQTILVGRQGGSMSAPGDSGSLVVDRQLRACGLLFAGSDRVTVASPIRLVEEAMGVRF